MATLMLTLNTNMFRSTRQLPTRARTIVKILQLSVLTAISLLLFGCGGGTEAVDAAGKTVNSFARNTVTADEEIVQNGTSNTTSCSGTAVSGVTYCLAVEATETMIASWQTDLFNLITPGKAYAFRGLTTVPAKSISIIQVDENLNQVPNSLVPSYTITDNPELGTYSITFSESPPARIDIIAKITLDNGQVLLAPFIDSSIDQNFDPIVIVNVVSDFLVKQLYDKLNTAEALNSLLPCNDGGSDFGNNVDCKNQPFAKFSLWAALNGLTQNYEIDIPANYTITQAFQLLNDTGEFKTHIDTALNEILRTQEAFVGGTERELDPISVDPNNTLENLSTVEAYNSALFSLAFNQTNPDSGTKGASISTTVSSLFSDSNGAVSYPELTRNTSNLYVSLTNLNEDFPTQRTSLILSQANSLSLSVAAENSLSASPGNTFLTSQGFYVAGKIPFQTITDKTSTTGKGWQSDPYTQLYYSPDSSGNEPQAMISSFVRNGSNYAISTTDSLTWKRDSKLEEQSMFAWVQHTQVPEDNDGYPINTPGEGFINTDNIAGKDYGAINFSVKLDSSGNILTSTGKISKWSAISTDQIDQSQPLVTLSGEDHYLSYSFTRDTSQTLAVSTPSPEATFSRNYAVSASKKSSDSGIQDLYLGRLTVSAPGNSSEQNQASSTPTGSMITVTQNEAAAGQGLINALEVRTIAPADLTNTVYRLAGNSFGANAASNVLRSYNNSTIEFTGGTTATLTFNALESTHNVSTQEVSGISELSIPAASGTYIVNNDGLIQFTFLNVQGTGKTLRLKGFMSKSVDSNGDEIPEPGNVLTLLMIHDYDEVGNTQATLGLVHAFKELNLDIKIQ